jgi:Aerotolerance regulator N-terminal/von Willebrand factor type A domain
VTFAHPILLWGALAALIPLLIHLFDRRRPRPHPFGAISFVLKSHRRNSSRLKLRRLILYALRTLLLLALPIALARPEWRKDEAVAPSAKGPAATVVVLDTSLSMRWVDGRSHFELGKDEARSALRELSNEEPASLLPCGPNPVPPGTPGFERGRLLSVLDELEASRGAAELNRCLELAALALAESPIAAKRIVLVSDFTASALRLETPLPTVTGPKGEQLRPEMVLRDVAAGLEELPNVALLDARSEPAPQVGPRAWQFTFTARNFSAQPKKDLELQLKVEGQVVAKGFFDLPAHGTAQKSLTHRFDQGGSVVVEGALTPDALPDDDSRALVLAVPRELRALVVNGAASTQKLKDEAWFTEAALAATGSPVRATVRDADSAWREDFNAYDVVLVLNAAAPSHEVAERLRAFVEEKGGGLFLSMGERVEADAWNAAFGPVLPRRLRLVKTAVEPGQTDSAARAARLSQVSWEHPVFTPFVGRAREGLSSARFYRYMLLESETPGAQEPSAVLAALEDGAPALAAARRGKGRVLLFTSTVDRDWGDFAIRTAFLPLMQRLCAWLTGSLDEREELHPRVAQTVSLKPEAGVEPSLVKSPGGKELPALRQQDGSYSVGPLLEPGAHRVLAKDGKPIAALAFAVGLDPAESDLTRLKGDELSAWFGEDTVKASGAGGAQKARPLWTWLLVVAALAFVAEGLLLRK